MLRLGVDVGGTYIKAGVVDENYTISLVGSKTDNFLWILSRTPVPDPDLLQAVLDEAQARGYDTSKLIWVDQSRNIAAQK